MMQTSSSTKLDSLFSVFQPVEDMHGQHHELQYVLFSKIWFSQSDMSNYHLTHSVLNVLG